MASGSAASASASSLVRFEVPNTLLPNALITQPQDAPKLPKHFPYLVTVFRIWQNLNSLRTNLGIIFPELIKGHVETQDLHPILMQAFKVKAEILRPVIPEVKELLDKLVKILDAIGHYLPWKVKLCHYSTKLQIPGVLELSAYSSEPIESSPMHAKKIIEAWRLAAIKVLTTQALLGHLKTVDREYLQQPPSYTRPFHLSLEEGITFLPTITYAFQQVPVFRQATGWQTSFDSLYTALHDNYRDVHTIGFPTVRDLGDYCLRRIAEGAPSEVKSKDDRSKSPPTSRTGPDSNRRERSPLPRQQHRKSPSDADLAKGSSSGLAGPPPAGAAHWHPRGRPS